MVRSKLFVGFSTSGMSTRRNWTLYDLELVKKDLLNHLQTRKGERVMMPKYGTVIWDLLFDPFTEYNRSLMIDDVKRIIAADPRVKLVGLDIASTQHGITIEATVKYEPWDVVESFSVNFDRRSQEGK